MRTLTFSLQQDCILVRVSFEFNKKVVNGLLRTQMSDLFVLGISLPLTAGRVSVVYSMTPADTTSSLVHTKCV